MLTGKFREPGELLRRKRGGEVWERLSPGDAVARGGRRSAEIWGSRGRPGGGVPPKVGHAVFVSFHLCGSCSGCGGERGRAAAASSPGPERARTAGGPGSPACGHECFVSRRCWELGPRPREVMLAPF